jgi:glycosyltransferase involved in cell wall biosynthesis
VIRVVRVIARLNIGGPAIHVTLLTERLDPSRYDSVLVTGSESAGEGNYLSLRNRQLPGVVTIPQLGREIQGLGDVLALRALVRLFRGLRPHIVHTHTAKAGTLGRLAAWLCRVPVIVHTYHGHVLRGYFSATKTRAFVGIERALARVSDQLIAVSPAVRRDLLAMRIGRPDRFAVVPLGLELDRFLTAERHRGELRRELGIPSSTPIVGIVARLVPIKAHEVFLEAARLLAARHPGVQCLVVGDGERREELEALTRSLGLHSTVRFLGWRADLECVYADLDVVVLTSRNEGSPVALIEAMAAARAIVSTDVGGVSDVVADGITGRLVPCDEASGIGAAVSDLIQREDERAALGARARARVAEQYGAARLVRDVDALYSALLGNGSGSRRGRA